MLWQLVVAAAALGAAYYRWSRRRLYRLAREVPSGMKEYPVIGHAYKFLGSNEDRMNTLQKLGRVANRQNGLSSVWLSHRLYICLTDPEAIDLVSKVCLDKDEFTHKYFRAAIGNGSIFAPVNIWHPRRKISAPFFNKKNLDQMVLLFHQKSSIMADLMRAEAGGGDFPVWNYMTTYTFDTVGETAVGLKLNSQENPEHFSLRAIQEVCSIIATRIFQPWLHPDFIFERLPISKQFANHMQRANTFLNEIIRRKRNDKEENGMKRKCRYGIVVDCNKTGYTNFIDMVIHSSGGEENGYSDEELREEVLVVIVAGNDSSAVGTSFTAVMLSRYPDVQEKVFQELREVFGDSDRAVTPEDLLRLTYLDAVVKESLRLYPPVPLTIREVREDLQLPSGLTLVEGSSVMFNIWGTHRNPAYWGEDAELFRPERFLEGPLRHPAQFIPFSYSIRNCIGGTYAMISMKTGLVSLLRRYKLLPPANVPAEDLNKPLKLKFVISMKAVDNFIIRIEERNYINKDDI